MKVSVSEAGEVTMSDSKNQTRSLEVDPIVEEVVTFNPMELQARYDRAEFAAVVFQNISEVYPINAHIECSYTITADIVPTSRDWVALYKVGWMNPAKDYVYYEWAPMPKDYESGKESEASILFPAHKMPGDDGEFYQFCYVSSTGQIRGASTPFQFRKPNAADYIEVDDPDTNMLVIQSRSVYLQENLQAAESQKNLLLQEQEKLVKDLDRLARQLKETQEELNALLTQNADLKSKLKHEQAHIAVLNKEAGDMNLIHDEQRIKIANLMEEKEDLEKKIGNVHEEILALTSSLKKLQADKDDLEGQKKSLEDQVTIYKEHFASSESAAELYSRQLQELQSMISDKEELVKHLQENIAKLTRELQMERESFDSQALQYVKSTEKIEMLEEKLRNTEDKLSAAEESRGLAAKELKAYKEIHAQLTADIEKTRTDNHYLKSKVSDMEKDFQQRAAIMKEELDATQQDLKGVLQEKEQAQMQKSQLQERLETASMNSSLSEFSMNSSMSAMKLALSQLKERLEKKEKQTRNLEKALNLREKEFARSENDLKREIEDLKEKIYMCGEEYKVLLIEKTKIQRKLEKVVEKKKSKMQRAKSEEVQIERFQKSSAASTIMKVKPPSMREEDAQGDVSSNEIQQHIDDLEHEMNSHVEKKEKYKKLYNEEKARNRELMLEIAEKETENQQLRKKIKPVPLDYDYKIRSLEKCVAEKEADIEMLNQKLRDSVREKEALKASASSSPKVAATSTDSSDPSGTDYPFVSDIDEVSDSMDLLKLVPSAPPVHEDRFLDAPGEPMKMCPVCNKSFPLDVADIDFENHVMDHVEGLCPVCRMSKGQNMTDDDFMRHVNKHYDQMEEN